MPGGGVTTQGVGVTTHGGGIGGSQWTVTTQ